MCGMLWCVCKMDRSMDGSLGGTQKYRPEAFEEDGQGDVKEKELDDELPLPAHQRGGLVLRPAAAL